MPCISQVSVHGLRSPAAPGPSAQSLIVACGCKRSVSSSIEAEKVSLAEIIGLTMICDLGCDPNSAAIEVFTQVDAARGPEPGPRAPVPNVGGALSFVHVALKGDVGEGRSHNNTSMSTSEAILIA